MLRRWFRTGIRLGLLVGILVAVVKIVQARRTAEELARDGWAGSPAWTPPAAPPEPAPPPAWVEPIDGVCPPSHPVKVKLSSGIFHLPGMLAYERTRPDRCYLDAEAAAADGFTRAKR